MSKELVVVKGAELNEVGSEEGFSCRNATEIAGEGGALIISRRKEPHCKKNKSKGACLSREGKVNPGWFDDMGQSGIDSGGNICRIAVRGDPNGRGGWVKIPEVGNG